MTEIDPYIKIMLLTDTKNLELPAGRFRLDEISLMLLDVIEKVTTRYNANDVVDHTEFTVDLFEELKDGGVFYEENERFAGTYYVYSQSGYVKYRDATLTGSEIHAASQRIGQRFFPDVLEGYRRTMAEGESVELPTVAFAPASNRIVSLQHNQIEALEGKTTEIIEAVSTQNHIAGRPGFREMIIGQLKAGRELIRAGEFRLYLLQISLIETLKWLSEKYAKDAIGDLAVRLLEALAENLGAF